VQASVFLENYNIDYKSRNSRKKVPTEERKLFRDEIEVCSPVKIK
jgi:hypothetical protein